MFPLFVNYKQTSRRPTRSWRGYLIFTFCTISSFTPLKAPKASLLLCLLHSFPSTSQLPFISSSQSSLHLSLWQSLLVVPTTMLSSAVTWGNPVFLAPHYFLFSSSQQPSWPHLFLLPFLFLMHGKTYLLSAFQFQLHLFIFLFSMLPYLFSHPLFYPYQAEQRKLLSVAKTFHH